MDVSFSRLHKYETCGAAYQYHYVRGLRSEQTPANLVFGKALHKALTDYVAAHARGETLDVVSIFTHEWTQALAGAVVEFPSTHTPESMYETGVELCRQFPTFWENSGLTAVIDRGGNPMVEQKFTMQIARSVKLRGFIDVLAMTADGDIGPIDLKTSASAAPESTLLIGEQLTDYQMLVEANQERYGLEGVDTVGFVELLKRKVSKTGKGPEIIGPNLAPARSRDLVAERRTKIEYLVTQIRKGVFFRNPGMAYNSPCAMCDFRELCLHGSMEGLTEPAQAQQKLA